jgi:hypothetical protein
MGMNYSDLTKATKLTFDQRHRRIKPSEITSIASVATCGNLSAGGGSSMSDPHEMDS